MQKVRWRLLKLVVFLSVAAVRLHLDTQVKLQETSIKSHREASARRTTLYSVITETCCWTAEEEDLRGIFPLKSLQLQQREEEAAYNQGTERLVF